jgi:hypothetical protein
LQEVTGHEINIETDHELMRQADIKRQCGDNKKLFELLPELSPPIAFEKTMQWMVES